MDNLIDDSVYLEKIKLGQMTSVFLESKEWKELVKPVIDSMLAGISDIRFIKQSEISSAKKTESIILGRQMAANYLSEIETTLLSQVADGKYCQDLLEKKKAGEALYKRK